MKARKKNNKCRKPKKLSVEERCINQTKLKFQELLESKAFEISDEYVEYFCSTACGMFVRAQDALMQVQNQKSVERIANFVNEIEEKIRFLSIIDTPKSRIGNLEFLQETVKYVGRGFSFAWTFVYAEKWTSKE
eukprot:TRINITY_DN9954_c0_g1_i1.p1 TRINITY_DN9954_c0_g1~~TRINITY_DN9954_c0_g1_i1.p1  ORF type:complete len:134 (+),score=17.27 TRINITY_DN9954_c0_g1_i1:41-442(+)